MTTAESGGAVPAGTEMFPLIIRALSASILNG